MRCIGATKLTLSHVLKRTLDVDENVRKAAYKFIADKVHIRSMTISKREEIVRRGLTDRNDKVKDLVAKDLGMECNHFYLVNKLLTNAFFPFSSCLASVLQ